MGKTVVVHPSMEQVPRKDVFVLKDFDTPGAVRALQGRARGPNST